METICYENKQQQQQTAAVVLYSLIGTSTMHLSKNVLQKRCFPPHPIPTQEEGKGMRDPRCTLESYCYEGNKLTVTTAASYRCEEEGRAAKNKGQTKVYSRKQLLR